MIPLQQKWLISFTKLIFTIILLFAAYTAVFVFTGV